MGPTVSYRTIGDRTGRETTAWAIGGSSRIFFCFCVSTGGDSDTDDNTGNMLIIVGDGAEEMERRFF